MFESSTIWVMPELDTGDTEPSKSSLGLLSEARSIAEQTGGEAIGVIFTTNPAPVPEILSQYGLSRVLIFQDPLFKSFSAEAYAAALLPRLRQNKPWIFLMGDTPAGRELAPRLAAFMECRIVTGCVKMDLNNPEESKFYRSIMGGQFYQEITLGLDRTIIVTEDIKTLKVAPPMETGKVKTLLIESALPADIIKTKHIENLPADFKTVDVTEADTIIAAGLGAISEEIYPLVTELASLLEGSIGATRPVIDSGKVSRDRLIGQTGKTVNPDVYLALGVSGASHHTGGIQDSGKIVAVNKDPLAPIFKNADTGAVIDLKEVLPKLIERIKKAKADGEIL